MKQDASMLFENTMKRIFGAHQIAGEAYNESAEKYWIEKALKQFSRDILKIDMPERHRHLILSKIEIAIRDIKGKGIDYRILSLHMIAIASMLIGYSGSINEKPFIIATPIYNQNIDQYITDAIRNGEDEEDLKKTTSQLKIDMIRHFIRNGKTVFQIAIALNTSENNIKNIIREYNLRKP